MTRNSHKKHQLKKPWWNGPALRLFHSDATNLLYPPQKRKKTIVFAASPMFLPRSWHETSHILNLDVQWCSRFQAWNAPNRYVNNKSLSEVYKDLCFYLMTHIFWNTKNWCHLISPCHLSCHLSNMLAPRLGAFQHPAPPAISSIHCNASHWALPHVMSDVKVTTVGVTDRSSISWKKCRATWKQHI